MKTIIEMAREAGFNTNHEMIWINKWEVSPYMQRFAALVRADEREACAKVYEELAENARDAMALRFQQIAATIRARGNT